MSTFFSPLHLGWWRRLPCGPRRGWHHGEIIVSLHDLAGCVSAREERWFCEVSPPRTEAQSMGRRLPIYDHPHLPR
jgi:hypothetical protein